MTKTTLTDLANLENQTAVSAINANNAILEIASDNTLSRDGTSPNQMGAVLDMNSHRIINLPAADTSDQPVTKAQLDAIGNGYLGNNILVGTSHEVNVTSGGGTSTFGLPSALTYTGKTVTGGTFSSPTISSPTVSSGTFTTPTISSPSLTGVPTAPTAAVGTNTTQIATTAFVAESAVPGVNFYGDGVTDNTAALQAVVDGLPQGGTIYIQGWVKLSSLDLHGKYNITFKGVDAGAQTGSGYGRRAKLEMTTGAVGAGVGAINCFHSQALVFDNLFIYATNAAFDGTLLQWGSPTAVPGQDTVFAQVNNCILQTVSASARCMDLHGSTNGSFRNLIFSGPGIHIYLQNNSYLSVDFVNSHLFDSIIFEPTGTVYPVQGSCFACVFVNCSWEPCSDGRLRAITTSTARPFGGLTIINPALYDPSVGGIECFTFPWGSGLTIIGGAGSSPIGYVFALGGGGGAHGDPEVRGLRGVTIQGFAVVNCGAMIDFYGTKALKTNTRGIRVFGNSVTVGLLIGSGYTECENAEFGPNNIYANLLGLGSGRTLIGWPTYVDAAAAAGAGMTTGEEFIATGAANALQIIP